MRIKVIERAEKNLLDMIFKKFISFGRKKTMEITQDLRIKIEPYLDDIEHVTKRAITKKQRELIVCYVKRNRFFRLDTSTYKERKKEYKEKRVELRKEWENETSQKWPQYESDVLDGRGKVVRKKGQYYDVHHIIELSFAGPDVWYNLFPARHPDEHQNGIHRKGSLASEIFG